jgi:hypothetical protein
MRKTWMYIILFSFFALFIFWLLHKSLWLERFLIYGRMPLQGKTWQNEVEKAEKLYPEKLAGCYFLGDSHMEQCEWQELFPELPCANRGIGGETTEGLLKRLHTLPARGMGSIVFLQTGINDLFAGEEPEGILQRYTQILDSLLSKNYRPVPTLVFPVRYLNQVNEKVPVLNAGIVKIAQRRKISVISLNAAIIEGNRLSSDFTADGVHLNYRGYHLWASEIRKLPGFLSGSGSKGAEK